MIRRPRLALVFLLLLGSANPGLAADDPAAIVQAYYQAEESGGADVNAYLSQRLLALYHAAARNAEKHEGESVSGLDFSVAVSGQDWEDGTFQSLRLAVLSQRDDRAEVKATFKNFRQQDLRYLVVREGERWVIDDIRSVTETWLWSDLLRTGARE